MSDPTPDAQLALDALANAIGNSCRAQWTIRRLRGEEWLDVPQAPSTVIIEALDAAWRLGCAAGLGNGVCHSCKRLVPVAELADGECRQCLS